MTDTIARIRTNAAAMLRVVEVHALDTPEREAAASEMLRVIKTLHAEGDEARKAEKAPHLAAGREVDERYKPALRELERVEKMIKSRLAEVAKAREATRLAALETARLAAQAGDAEAANDALADLGMDFDRPAGVSERWSWEVSGVDLRAVPVEYLMLDTARVRAEIAVATREGREPKIEGVTFERKATIVARRYT